MILRNKSTVINDLACVFEFSYIDFSTKIFSDTFVKSIHIRFVVCLLNEAQGQVLRKIKERIKLKVKYDLAQVLPVQ